MKLVDPSALPASAPIRSVNPFRTFFRFVAITALLSAVAVRASYTLNWDDNSDDETGFTVERSVNGGAFATLITLAPNTTTYQDTTADGTSTYAYRVYASNAIGNSATTNVATNAPTFTTQPPATPSAPIFGNITLTAAASGLPAPTYHWQKNGNPLSDGATGSGSTVAGSSTASLTISNLQATDAATYTVVASNGFTPDATSGDSVLTLSKAVQTITFGALSPVTYSPNATVNLTGTTNSTTGIPVTYTSSNANVATVSGSVVTIVGTGNTTITANAAADATYLAAPPVSQTLTVNASPQTITFGALSAVTYSPGLTLTLGATTTSVGTTITYTSSNLGVATVTGNTVTILSAGSTTITANQAGNSNYLAATAVPQVLTINKASQTITFNSLPVMVAGSPPYTLVATSSAGLPVSFASSNFNVAATGGTNGSTLTIGSGGGTANITATQIGNGNYSAAAPVVQPLTVNKAPVFTTQPGSATVNAGNGGNFVIVANGIPTPTFQWQISTNSGGSWSDISGATGTSYGISATTASQDGYQFRCVATNSIASVASNAAVLTVHYAPTFTTAAANTFAVTGGNASFTVAVSGNPTPTFQWKISTTAGGSTFTNLANSSTYSGVTTPTLSITGATTALNGFVFQCVATNTLGSNSSSAVLTVGNVAPAFTTNPASVSVPAGTNASFTVAATGGPAPTYQWQFDSGSGWSNLANDSTYSGVTTPQLTITAASTALDGYQYRCLAINAAAPTGVPSTAATLTVTTTPPAITAQPTSVTSANGGTASFTTIATGNPVPTMTWELSTDNGTTWNPLSVVAPYTVTNTSPTPGTISSVLAISDVTGLGGVRYRCVASNGATPDATSNAAILTVQTTLAPSFTTQPANQIVPLGGNASFTVGVTGVPTPTLQWQVSTDGGTTWTPLSDGGQYSGTGSPTLTITGVTSNLNAAQYECVATNSAAPGGVASSPATLAVVTVAPTITVQPNNQSTGTGGSVSFFVAATGTPTPTFQWEVSTDSGVTWHAVSNGGVYSGVTTSTLTITGATTALNNNQYRALASNAGGATPSAAATLTVSAAPPANVAPTIVIQPAGQIVNVGGPISLSVYATGSPTPTYQWRCNGTPIPGATDSDFFKSNAQASDAGVYDVVATNVAGSIASVGVTVTVKSGPVITTQPVNATVMEHASASFSVVAIGATPLTYQWTRNGAAIAGATGATLALTNVQPSDAASYAVVVTNSLGTATSSAATLTVTGISFAGDYFGTLSGGGTWALHVHSDNTATYLAFLPDRHSAIVVQLTIDASGTFTTTGSEIVTTSTTSTAAVETPPIAAAVATFTLSGSIGNGQVSGQLAGIGQTLSGSADTGNNADAGFYAASALGTSGGTTYSIIGPSGYALVVTATPTVIDGASGTINAAGQLIATTSNGAQLTVTLNPQSLSLAATYAGTNSSINFSGVADTVPVTTRIINLSARSVAGTGSNTLIAGFVVTGSTSKALLVRGIGPTLANYQVSGPLADPVLGIYSGTTSILTNDDWGSATNAPDIATTASSVGAFSLPAASHDAAALTMLAPGAYTAQVSGKPGDTGVALVELYDAAKASDARLVNVSARTQVGTGGNVLIVGFVIDGNAPKQYLIRAVGPTLTNFNVSGVLADPQLSIVVQGTSTTLQQNDNWGGGSALKAAFTTVGAFSLPDNSADAAMLITLQPGAYSAVVSGVNNTTGVALVELYEMP
ncbi:MAG TPA: immunoglobulin domain-containing protein [Opitutaceae bacterium]|nr:immunoglobulin domain-containing protein [Opitutaceae bacterium]